MSSTPKTVTFQVPGRSNLQRAATAPVRTSYRCSLKSPTGVDDRVSSPKVTTQPDLIADIVKLPPTSSDAPKLEAEQPPADGARLLSPKAKGQEEEQSTLLPSGEDAEQSSKTKTKADSTHDSKVSMKSGHRRSSAHSTVYKSEQVSKMAYQVREKTNISSHDHIRLMKYDVARLREHLVKLEDEIRHANRGKGLLEVSIQDVRKSLSVNQQSVSTQQKKTREEDPTLKLLGEESRVLSRSKRRIEHHLATIKTHLQSLDSVRRTLKSKIALLSRALGLDAQNFKVYSGPVIVRAESISKQRHYSNACPHPTRLTKPEGDEGIAQMCSKVLEAISASKAVRSEIKTVISSAQNTKDEAHKKISTAVTKTIEDQKLYKRELTIQRGKVRIEHNSINHKKHSEEIALGIAMGPISDKYRSVSEKMDRPLSRLRPGSAVLEQSSYKKTANHLTRQLSASTVRASQTANSDLDLERKIQENSQTSIIDLETRRVRKASLDNRWIRGESLYSQLHKTQ